MLNKYIREAFVMRKYKNILEALYVSKIIRKVCGISIFVLDITPDNRIVRKFTLLGFICFLLWYSLYFYSTFKAQDDDQSILRKIYSTKVQRYGDDFERISSTIYVIFAMWKIPYSLSRNIRFMEIMINVDKSLEKLGENVDYNRDARSAFNMAMAQVIICLVRLFSIWATLSDLDVSIPLESMYQVLFSDALALVSSAHFCFFLMVIEGRFKYINKVLAEIKSHKSWEYKIFVRSNMTASVQKAVGLQDRYICEKIRACAQIYGMLYKVTDATNKMFGTMLVLTMLVYLAYIILYMFYFMEATAAGLFHDVPRYIVFLVYVFWQIGYAIVIIFLIVYCSEGALYEVSRL